MRGLLFILILFITNFPSQSQEMNRKIIDDRFNKKILIGYVDRMGLQEGDFGEFFKLEFKDYKPDKEIIKKLKKHKNDFTIALVMGAWCPDCQELVPQFYKIMEEAGISDTLMKVICVDGHKSGRDVSLEKYKIEKVPTFIFYRKGKEIGRIIEHPKDLLEEDFLRIIDGTSGNGPA